MAAKAVVKLAFSFQDRGGRKALLTCYLPFVASEADCISFASTLIASLGVLSDANIIGYTYTWQWTTDSEIAAAIGSNSRRALALFYRNDDRYEAIYIPSANMELTASGDNYDGIRVNYADPTTQGLIDAFTATLENVVTIEGLPFPGVYVVGGIRI